MNVKILSLNLWEGGLLCENIEKFLQKETPDILCLQEVFNGDADQAKNFQSLSWLTALFPDYHSFYSPDLFEDRSDGEGDVGNLILSRFPFVEKKTIFLQGEYQKIVRPDDKSDFSKDPQNMQCVILDIEGEKLCVANVHGIWGLDGSDSPERLQMSETIVNEIEGKTQLVVMGDFNLKPDTQTIANIEKHLINVFKGDMTTSFNMKHKTNPGYATAVVDMFFSSRDVKIISKRIPDDDVSDHKPLVVTIAI